MNVMSIPAAETYPALPTTRQASFTPEKVDFAAYGQYELTNPRLLDKPADVPADFIAYNPSAIWTVRDKAGNAHDVFCARVEPNRSNGQASHLGKSMVRAYICNVEGAGTPLRPFYEMEELHGEDPALTRINRRLRSGKMQRIWLLSMVDAQPKPDALNEVRTLRVRFYAGENLHNLEHIADGPEWMKDIRIAPSADPASAELEVYGRPQPESYSGNITHTTITGIEHLSEDAIAEAGFINPDLLPIGSGVWGGVNDVIPVGHGKYILAAHRAWRTGEDGRGRHYEAVLFGHDVGKGTISELGIIATADMFPSCAAKADEAVDLHDVAFTGGGYNGTLRHLTLGIRDSNIGVGDIKHVGSRHIT